MKKLVIFDLDGTLLNTIDDITNSLNRSLIKVGLYLISKDQAKYFVGSGVDILIERVLRYELKDNYDSNKDNYFFALKDAYVKDYSLNCRIDTKPYDGIKELIIELKKKGINVAVLSNKPHEDTINVINYYFGEDFFDIVYGKKPHNKIKPSPDGAFELIKELENRYSNRYKKSDIMYVGDTSVDMETAKNIGCESIGCLWGFRSIDELTLATYIANNPLDIYDLVNKNYDGIIILNKHENISSNNIINDLKHELNKDKFPISKIGHCGTLDPIATGVMVVLIDGATKLSNYLMSDEKEYDCLMELGKSYDTLDITGKIIDERDLNQNDLNYVINYIDSVFNSLSGERLQTPPMYSSIKKEGIKLYEYARCNEKIEVNDRLINIKNIKLIDDIKLIDNQIYISFHSVVSKGTYIRSLCKEIGDKFNMPASLVKLNRTRSGKFDLSIAKRIEEIINDNKNNKLEFINMIDCMKLIGIKTIEINDYLFNRVKNGNLIRLALNDKEVGLIYNNQLIALYELNDKDNNNYNNKNSYKVKILWR
ncbi:MAG: tRNA pseudouridine(55) synthase TruB [Bacilli bacterium]|nr:tRNA pseudouridine(55) synthase TruB [Bacilli bacterium]